MLNIRRMSVIKKDRIMGCLIGLAVGDSYGTTWEFTPKSKMPENLPNKIIGGGPFNLQPGDWTDDTSMALCLAESLLDGWDPNNQMNRYINWWKHGYNSVTGNCFDIGISTRQALSFYNTNGKYIIDNQAAGNGVLMRLAPIPMVYYGSKNLLEYCAYQSYMTHPSSQSIECSMIMGAIIGKILSGERNKEEILNFDNFLDTYQKEQYNFLYNKYNCVYNERIEGIKKMLYDDNLISGSGYCVDTLEAALWSFLNTDSYISGLKKVVSLGQDTDTTGAVYGQIAGAYYGLDSIIWSKEITWFEKIHMLSENLFNLNINI